MSEELKAQEELGRELKGFLLTNAGKYLIGCSAQDIEEAKTALLDLDPHQYSTLVELQNAIAAIQKKARVSQAMTDYIAEAIINAEQALHQLENEGQD